MPQYFRYEFNTYTGKWYPTGQLVDIPDDEYRASLVNSGSTPRPAPPAVLVDGRGYLVAEDCTPEDVSQQGGAAITFAVRADTSQYDRSMGEAIEQLRAAGHSVDEIRRALEIPHSERRKAVLRRVPDELDTPDEPGYTRDQIGWYARAQQRVLRMSEEERSQAFLLANTDAMSVTLSNDEPSAAGKANPAHPVEHAKPFSPGSRQVYRKGRKRYD